MVLEVLQEEATVNEITAQHGLNTVMVSRWKTDFLERAADVFKRGPSEADKELAVEKERVARLERKVGQLTYEVDWLKKNLKKLSSAGERKPLLEAGHVRLAVKRQAELLSVNRTSVNRKSSPPVINEQDLFLMRRIDEIHTDEPTWGYRTTITHILRREAGIAINRKKVHLLMRDMGIYTIYPKPNLSKRYHHLLKHCFQKRFIFLA